MSWRSSIQTAIRELKKEETALQRKLDQLRSKIRELEKLGRGDEEPPAARPKRKRKRLSPEGRAAISRAAKKRWARYRAAQRKP